ncbi:hypothetical protein RHMOL_Rhmol13G0213400 [Rhododendron molle]|uniref:Uncharacterized protein n=1 Tax=Rhododendron molle TaxID=49168 RepID=A0ACC0LA64_RHOML|nr:hypothetical protein RHMOL_Rhmol13G0213400 [Rhododendron molle]
MGVTKSIVMEAWISMGGGVEWEWLYVIGTGRFIAARAIGKQFLTDPLVVEAMAARDSLLFAMEMGLESVTIEGDSQQLVQLVQRRKEGHPGVGVLVADIMHILAGFSSAEVSFVRRSGNGVAHSIAQKAVRGLVSSTW